MRRRWMDIRAKIDTVLIQKLSGDRARKSTLMLSDGPVQPLPPIESLRIKPVVPKPDPASPYPFENLAFEGGGAKGYAYIGAIEVLEEIGIYPGNVRRVAGTSMGSFIAMMAALGCSSSYMIEKFPKDMLGLVTDSPGGRIGSIMNAVRTRGMHPGKRVFDTLGDIVEDVTGARDITFAQVQERYGRELCVPVTNLTRMMTEYCHPKTTPNMSIRVAVRMSMSLPVLLQPVLLTKSGEDGAVLPEIYVDGGLLCNDPTHAFDGWWLSTAPGDAFLRRLRPLNRAHEHYPRAARFSPNNPKTLGFTVFAFGETDITSRWVRPGGDPPTLPNTPAALRGKEARRAQEKHASLSAPLQHLLETLDDFDADQDGQIDEGELTSLIDQGGLSSSELLSIFGTTDAKKIFDTLDLDGSGTIDYGELLAFLESRDVDVTTHLVGFAARPPKSAVEFAVNMLEAMTRDLTRANYDPADRARTIPINTDYVGTQTFDLQQADRDFLIETARRSTMAFFAEYDEMARARAGVSD